MQGLEEAVYRNISACREMTEITKSSFGPNGKMMIIKGIILILIII